jgi:hypothetical protein
MTRKAKDHQYLWYRGGRKMPGKSGRDDENKKSSKKNQYRTQETKRNQYVNPPPNMKAHRKKKEKEKQLASAPTLWVGNGPPHQVCSGDSGLVATYKS